MKAFSNLKRDFRTRYKPRGRDMRRGNAQALDEDDSESLRPDTAMTQDSVMSTREDIMSDAHFANLAYRSQQVMGSRYSQRSDQTVVLTPPPKEGKHKTKER
jgi:hypothetical protein